MIGYSYKYGCLLEKCQPKSPLQNLSLKNTPSPHPPKKKKPVEMTCDSRIVCIL
jgi:hypothetical protein